MTTSGICLSNWDGPGELNTKCVVMHLQRHLFRAEYSQATRSVPRLCVSLVLTPENKWLAHPVPDLESVASDQELTVRRAAPAFNDQSKSVNLGTSSLSRLIA